MGFYSSKHRELLIAKTMKGAKPATLGSIHDFITQPSVPKNKGKLAN